MSKQGNGRIRQSLTAHTVRWPYASAIAVYVAVRFTGVLLLAVMSRVHGETLLDRLTAWDGQWYLRIARFGYSDLPETVDAAGLHYPDAPMAFFPLYPSSIRMLTYLGVNAVSAALLVPFLAGLVLASGLMRIGRLVGDRGDRTGLILVALVAGAPMAITLSMAYTEALFCAFAVWALIGLLERNWLLAGWCTMAAGLTRSTAAVLIVVVIAAAVLATRKGATHQRGRALACALLAPLGLASYWTFVGISTGSWTGWQDIELRGWDTGFDFGQETVEYAAAKLTGDGSVMGTLTVLILLATLALAAVAVCSRQHWQLTLYGIGVLLMVLTVRGLPDAKVRFILPALPALLIPVAVGLSHRRLTTAIPAVLGILLLGSWFSAHALTAWQYAI